MAHITTPYYLEDLSPGMCFETEATTMTEADIIRFGREFDPQPHHVDPEAARHTLFGGLVASGWHTIGVMTALAVRSGMPLAEGQIGVGVEGIRFAKPVRPGDRIRLHLEILEARPRESRPGWGVVRVQWTGINQHDEVVVELQPSVLVRARDGEIAE
ncbi:MaoC family dehydratase [Ectothiorhodospira lacustris]|uniref:MaoC family dehydratase n=1 Tax=Ectothiorhodospira lacustris TaxID=2899127 RepID=UPI001EE7A78E|nr:MaoC family dehydratase [Ectothiorhodospira lacustris]MCG5501373.1 MaoC family dehydratase [Ectothiorhodospira lacustris]